jgi:uncharacterized protein YqgC (DUF456 family)
MISILFVISSLFQFLFVGISLIGLPGNILSLIFPILWWIGDKLNGGQFFAIILLIILGEIAEQFTSIASGKKSGINNKSLIISFISSIFLSIFLAPFFFGLGAIAGAFLGAFLGTYLYEFITTKDKQLSIKRGIAVLKGRLLGTILKLSLGISSVVYTTVSLFKNL